MYHFQYANKILHRKWIGKLVIILFYHFHTLGKMSSSTFPSNTRLLSENYVLKILNETRK